jgi:cation diffusion facilitator CzcD-associated flavoprotein CzcO
MEWSHMPRTDAKSKRRFPSCIIIGAGLAGLAAAHYLSRRRWSVTVLKNHGSITRLCKTLNLKLIPHAYEFSFWNASPHQSVKTYRPGTWPFSSAAKERFDLAEGLYGRRSHHWL